MCGIFGFIAREGINSDFFRDTVKGLFRFSETRGKEAAGAAARTPKSLSILKGPVPASDFIRSQAFQAFSSTLDPSNRPVALIGHSRLVTHGTQDQHSNNQPVAKAGMVCVHNGIVANESKLWQANPDLERLYQVDTEVLLSLTSKYMLEGAGLAEAVRRTFAQMQGAATIAALFQDNLSVLLATNTGSLYVCRSTNHEGLLFASEKYILTQLLDHLPATDLFRVQHIEQIIAGRALLVDATTLDETPFSLSPESADRADPAPAVNVPIVDLGEVPGGKGHAPIQGSALTKETERVMLDAWESFYQRDPVRRCRLCLLPDTMPGVSFDSDGVCNHCRHYTPHVPLGHEALEQRVKKYRKRSPAPDCLVPFSGGRDSCYGLLYVKEVLGMNPIAYTYDWGMVTDLGRRNQARVVGKLGVEHIIVSADIDLKRRNIRKNVEAWLKQPELGMIPLWMAGDKQLLYYGRKVMNQNNLALTIYSYGNKMEEVNHKIGFAGVTINDGAPHPIIPIAKKAQVASYYAKRILLNPSYINASLWDSAFAFWSLFLQKDESVHLFKYIDWDEESLLRTIINEFDWEMEPDTCATWRIDDGTVAFYNYIYLMVAGFTENDAFRSCQIRQGKLTREEAMAMTRMENRPRFESLEWYSKTVGFDINKAISIINCIPRLYEG